MRTTEEVLRQQEYDANYQRAHAGQTGATKMDNTILEKPFDTDTEEGSRQLIPAGKYTAQITDAIVKPYTSGRGSGVNFTWSIAEGEYEKRLVFQLLTIEHDNADAQRIGRGGFKDVCSSCGVTGQVTDLGVLLYKPCRITVGIRADKDGQYPDKNTITNVLPVPKPFAAPNGGTAQLKEASKTPPAFKASEELPDDSIPF
jgi:hypothetical protein